MTHNKRGTAILLAVGFAVVLLQFALAYSKMTLNTMPQTVQIDERVKLDHLARGLTEKAILKFQLYPADYYAAWEAAKLGNPTYLQEFTGQSPTSAVEFSISNFMDSRSSFSQVPMNIQLASMAIITDDRWKEEVLRISATANYSDKMGRIISKDADAFIRLKKEEYSF